MSAYSTEIITPDQAIQLILKCRAKKNLPQEMSIEEINNELTSYVQSQEYEDIVGVLINYIIQ